jgi:hypothetical protein
MPLPATVIGTGRTVMRSRPSRWIWKCCTAKRRKNDSSSELASEDRWDLVPLTPTYKELEHGKYVKAIAAALRDKKIWNIALSGSYGVGKSSILREVIRCHEDRVVELSLSTLAPIETSDVDESVPKQAMTPTNRIQQEIVKQLLYREEPHKTPGSRFHRLGRFKWRRELAIALLLGLPVAIIFLLMGWSKQIASAFSPLIDFGLLIHPLVWTLAAVLCLGARYFFRGQLSITQFSAGSTTVTLDNKSVSYFDQYLDEIVYFFDVSKRDIVIFEDIDRFNDSHIFETLRSLNTLLNTSPQIDRPIRFIYAIKDSIFDRIGLQKSDLRPDQDLDASEDPAQSETVRANRTKFFDLVIPVVPFITHRSARNLAAQLLDRFENHVDKKLLDLAAGYVPEMRLLKNVCNEFIVFRDRIILSDSNPLKLNETDLFAMMLYKSTHLTDFEAIRLRKSNLDTLYEVSRNLISQNTQRLQRERLATQRRLSQIDGAATRSRHLGKRLHDHVQRTVQAATHINPNGQYVFASQQLKPDDLLSAEFWEKFTSADGNPTLDWMINGLPALRYTKAHLAAELSDPLDAASWDDADRQHINERLQDISADLKFLRGADLEDLIERSDFLVEHGDIDQSFAATASKLLKSGLAYELVRAGYINSNFTLYTSTFHGDRVSSAATNFIIHHVERNLMDAQFKLDPGDVDDVVQECGEDALKEPSLYNIDLLDHLLSTNIAAAEIMIRSLVGFGDRQTSFMQAYLNGGTQQARLIARLTPFYSGVLVYLVSRAEVDDALQLELVDAALQHLGHDKYQTCPAVSSYLADRYAELATLTSDDVPLAQAERIGDLFAQASIRLPLLAPLTENMRRAFVDRSLYEIRRENIEVAIGTRTSLALDIVQAAHQSVYEYTLDNLSAYISAVEGVSPTVEGAERFISVIEDVLEHDSARLGDVIAHASPGCVVADLAEVSSEAWPRLAENERFPATFGNVERYVSILEAVDASLANVLTSAGTIKGADKADDESRAGLARAILSADEELLSAKLRTKLVASLNLAHPLETGEIAAESGELFALLLKYNLIKDEAATYAHLGEMDWSTREAYIRESREFKEYMSPDLVRDDLARLLQSDKVEPAIKMEIARQARDYVPRADRAGMSQIARVAAQQSLSLELEVVKQLALGGAGAPHVMALLEPHLPSLEREDLFTILGSMGADYPKLTSVGRHKVEIPDTAADRSLLDILKTHHIVKSYVVRGSRIKVNRRRK